MTVLSTLPDLLLLSFISLSLDSLSPSKRSFSLYTYLRSRCFSHFSLCHYLTHTHTDAYTHTLGDRGTSKPMPVVVGNLKNQLRSLTRHSCTNFTFLSKAEDGFKEKRDGSAVMRLEMLESRRNHANQSSIIII